jgi:peroxidase
MVVSMLVVATLLLQVQVLQAQNIFVGFYDQSCPQAEATVTQVVREFNSRDPTTPAGLLRLLFHDCFVEGCDGSILLDPTPGNPNTEKQASPNLTVRGYEVIDEAKRRLEMACPLTVSCADVVALAARDGAVLAGLNFQGLPLNMATGRWDGRVSSMDAANSALPSARSNVQQLTAQFGNKGLSQDEMVTLSGAHTIGKAHCVNFMDRIYDFPGSLDGVDPTLDPNFAAQLQSQCPRGNPNPNTVVDLDSVTPFVMDNRYYSNGFAGRVLFSSDMALFNDFETEFTSNLNVVNGISWNQKFGNALAQMAAIELKDEFSGEVRAICRRIN